MSTSLLRRVKPEALPKERHNPIDRKTLADAAEILEGVRHGGLEALLIFAKKLDGLEDESKLIVTKSQLLQAFKALPQSQQEVLERTAARIRVFAAAQRASIGNLEIPVPGGRAGHRVVPVNAAGCYAPGGRYPLPSSVLMTVLAAKAAGVPTVWVASPRPSAVTLGAAYIAGADALIQCGGAQAIAALAYGAGEIPRCNTIVGPGNRWVTAAKKLVAGEVGTDMLAGPSELVILTDGSVAPDVIAADLLAQAEHDPDALPILISLDPDLYEPVIGELKTQLSELSTKEIAEAALANGFFVHCTTVDEAIRLCNELAPEHLQLMTKDASALASKCTNFGSLFIGSNTPEVFGDYGAGPNHVLPTSGTAKFSGGLSVFHFLKLSTWLEISSPEDARGLAEDARALAELEGLHGHVRALEKRL